jgi:hypothetical protein
MSKDKEKTFLRGAFFPYIHMQPNEIYLHEFDPFLFSILQSELISVCGKNLRVLVDMLQAIDLQEAFVSKRKSREIRRKSSSEFVVLILIFILGA